jgi:hypothetical protein
MDAGFLNSAAGPGQQGFPRRIASLENQPKLAIELQYHFGL